MLTQLRHAAGYLAIFLMPALLAIGAWWQHPYLAFGAAMLVFPLARAVFGVSSRSEPILWSERVATLLDRLPVAYAAALVVALMVVMLALADGRVEGAVPAIGVGLSLWMTLLFATCPAHELVHRRNHVDVLVGWLVAGLAGYPALPHEHLIHHGRYGDTRSAEWPRVDESVWRFAWRRARKVATHASRLVKSVGDVNDSLRTQLVFAILVASLTCAAFVFAGGVAGLLIYVSAAVGVALGVQIITYLQHWGLGDDSFAGAESRQLAWEDDCLFQAWITLHLSFHQAHHNSPRQPFYLVTLARGSPRQPAGYVLLMMLCMFPQAWRRSMMPVLEAWKREPDHARSQGRRLTCFALYGPRAKLV